MSKISILFAALFILTASALTLISQGYRFDLNKSQITRIGGIYIKARPLSANVFVQGKLKGATSSITGDLFMQGYTPKNYVIRVEKDDYQTWTKTLEVKPSLVTEAKFITLFKEKYESDVVEKDLDIIKGNDYHIAKSDNYFYLIKNGVFKKIDANKKVPNIYATINGNGVYFTSKEKGAYDLFYLDEDSNNIKSIEIENFDVGSVNYLFINDKVVYLRDNDKNIYIGKAKYQNEDEITIQDLEIKLKNADFLKVINDKLYIINKGSKLEVFEKDFLEKIIEADISGYKHNEENKYNIELTDEGLIIQIGKSLIFYNKNKLIEIHNPVSDYKLSPDGKKIAIASGNEIIIFYIKESKSQPQHKKYDKIYLKEIKNNIVKLEWLDGNYILASDGYNIIAVESDDRDNVNLHKIYQGDNNYFYYSEKDNSIIAIKDKSFVVVKDITPKELFLSF